jgi:hypothetical protein
VSLPGTAIAGQASPETRTIVDRASASLASQAVAAFLLAIVLAAVALKDVRGPLELLQLWWWCAGTIWSGAILLRLFGSSKVTSGLLLEVVLGIAVTSLAVLAVVSASGLSAWAAMTAWSIATTLAAIMLRRGFRLNRLPELGLLAIACVASYAWTLPTRNAVLELMRSGRFPTWNDLFLHATQIARLGPYPAFGRGAATFVDTTPDFYHFGSYVLPSTLASLADVTPLDAAATWWVTLSFLVLATGIAAVAVALRGASLAAASLVALLAFPDASVVGLGNGFFGFHWLLVTVPGSGYGIGLVAAAVVLLLQWTKTHRLSHLIGAGVLGVATVMFRLHFAVLFVPVFLAVVLLQWPNSRNGRSVILALGAAILLALVLFGFAQEWRADLPYRMNLIPYLSSVLNQAPYFVPDVLAQLLSTNEILGIAFGIVAVVLSALGVFLIVYCVAVATRLAAGRLTQSDLLPGYFVLSFVFCMIFAPTPESGDLTEFKQRGFVLIYAMLIPWVVLAICDVLNWMRPSLSQHGPTVVIGTSLLSCTIVPLGFASVLATPRMSWAHVHYDTSVDRSLLLAGQYIAVNKQARDILAVDNLSPTAALSDQATILVAQTGVPTFLSRLGLYGARNGTAGLLVNSRLEILTKIHNAATLQEANELLRAHSLTWYVVGASDPPAWDPRGFAAKLSVGEWLVYLAR